MMDPRPKVSQNVDLTFLGVFSGYTNRYAMGRHTVPDYERDSDLSKWLRNKVNDPEVMLGIEFSDVNGVVTRRSDFDDLTAEVPINNTGIVSRGRNNSHAIRYSSKIKQKGIDREKRFVENEIRKAVNANDEFSAPNGTCKCGRPIQIPKMLSLLYPRAYIADGDVKFIVSNDDLCDNCARIEMVNMMCDCEHAHYYTPDNLTYDYSTSNNSTTISYQTTVGYYNSDALYTEKSIIPIAAYIEDHSERVSFYWDIVPLLSSSDVSSFGGIIPKRRALYQKLSNRFQNSAYANTSETYARIVKERLDTLVETIDDVWSADVDRLRSVLRVDTANLQTHIDITKTDSICPRVNVSSIASGYNTLNRLQCSDIVHWLAKLLNFELMMSFKSAKMTAIEGEGYTKYIANNQWTTVSAVTTNNITYVPNARSFNAVLTFSSNIYDDTQIL